MAIEFKRKVIKNHGSLLVNIPIEIVQSLDIEKGDTIGIILADNKFICRKVE